MQITVTSGADANAKDNNDQTPLHRAVSYRNREMCEVLVSAGADIYAKDKLGRTAADCIRIMRIMSTYSAVMIASFTTP